MTKKQIEAMERLQGTSEGFCAALDVFAEAFPQLADIAMSTKRIARAVVKPSRWGTLQRLGRRPEGRK